MRIVKLQLVDCQGPALCSTPPFIRHSAEKFDAYLMSRAPNDPTMVSLVNMRRKVQVKRIWQMSGVIDSELCAVVGFVPYEANLQRRTHFQSNPTRAVCRPTRLLAPPRARVRQRNMGLATSHVSFPHAAIPTYAPTALAVAVCLILR